jgi:serine/threonine-protein phosphatase PGAM5
MTRARQTAMIINEDFPKLELQQSRLLRECTPPAWREDIMAGLDSTRMSACSAQFEDAFAKYFIPSPDSTDRHDVLVCHGNVRRYFVTRSLRVDTLSWLQMSIGNCSLTIIRVRADGSAQLGRIQ